MAHRSFPTTQRLEAFPAWPLPEGPLARPAKDSIHLWFIPLRAVVGDDTLSEDERVRAANLHPAVRQRFITGRTALRELLAAYLDTAPARLRFTYNANGKPLLAASTLPFNLSHSGEHGLLAVGGGNAIGVDIETLRPRAQIESLARRMFDESAQAAIRDLHGEARVREFFRHWSLLEAEIKARGDGIFQRTAQKKQPPLTTIGLEIGTQTVGALALVAEEQHTIRLLTHRWPGSKE